MKYKTKYLNLKRGTAIHNLILVPMAQITTEDLQQLSKISNNRKIMSNIGSGKTWDLDYLVKLKNRDIQDRKNNIRYYQFYVKQNSSVVGYVSLRPLENYKELQIRIFVYPLNKGYGKETIKLLLLKYHSLLAVVREDNIASNNLFKSWDKKNKYIYYSGKKHFIYYKNLQEKN